MRQLSRFLLSSALLSVGCGPNEPGDSVGPVGAEVASDGADATSGYERTDSTSDSTPDAQPALPPAPLGRRTVGADAWLSCAIDSATGPGSVSCWGQLSSMVLSTPAPLGATPKRIEGLDDATDLAVGSDHVCAVTAGGGVSCFGFNHYGQLGLPKDEVFHPVAAEVLGVTNAVQVAVGTLHTCVRLEDGTVTCWGMGAWGQLGVPADPAADGGATPVVATGVHGAVKLAASGSHTCALLTDATVMCWGFNPFGETGAPADDTTQVPVRVDGIGPAMDLALSGNGTWILGVDGTVWFMGTHSSPEQIRVPTVEQVVPGSLRIDGSGDRACVTNAAGAVRCWAYWPQVRWGTGEPNRDENELVVEPTGGHVLRELALGLTHTCGRDATGAVLCWGQGGFGQVGPAEPGTLPVVDAPVLLQHATHVAAYHDGTCATIKGDDGGEVWCWGDNAGGRLGAFDDSAELPRRVDLAALPGSDAEAQDLAVGPDFACLVAGGRAFCWGESSASQLGGPGMGAAREVPGLTGLVRLTIGGAHACALRDDGKVACWGANALAQLGLGTYSASEPPTWLALPAAATDIAAGANHTCVVTVDQQALCWGLGKVGQLGVDVLPDQSLLEGAGSADWLRMYSKAAPQALSPTQVVRVTASGDETCLAHATGVSCYGQGHDASAGDAMLSGGDLSAERLVLSPWGGCRLGPIGAGCFGAFGALGSGQVGDVLDGAREVALGSYACVVEASGELRCYSDSDVQALAGTLDDVLTPRLVPLP